MLYIIQAAGSIFETWRFFMAMIKKGKNLEFNQEMKNWLLVSNNLLLRGFRLKKDWLIDWLIVGLE